MNIPAAQRSPDDEAFAEHAPQAPGHDLFHHHVLERILPRLPLPPSAPGDFAPDYTWLKTEIWLHLLRRRHDYRPGPCSYSRWLFAVALRKWSELLRRERRRLEPFGRLPLAGQPEGYADEIQAVCPRRDLARLEESPALPEPSERPPSAPPIGRVLGDRERLGQVFSDLKIRYLSKSDLELLHLRSDGWAYTRIAEELGGTPAGLRSRVTRLKRRLQAFARADWMRRWPHRAWPFGHQAAPLPSRPDEPWAEPCRKAA